MKNYTCKLSLVLSFGMDVTLSCCKLSSRTCFSPPEWQCSGINSAQTHTEAETRSLAHKRGRWQEATKKASAWKEAVRDKNTSHRERTLAACWTFCRLRLRRRGGVRNRCTHQCRLAGRAGRRRPWRDSLATRLVSYEETNNTKTSLSLSEPVAELERPGINISCSTEQQWQAGLLPAHVRAGFSARLSSMLCLRRIKNLRHCRVSHYQVIQSWNSTAFSVKE